MNAWGSIIALTYMAAQRVFPDYNDMADNKAYLESIARSFGYFLDVIKSTCKYNLTIAYAYYSRSRSERF